MKSFVTRQSDNIRKAYGRFEDELPRRCCFIGTTNNPNFLTDKTGNRRFYPVKVNIDGYELFERQNEIREYIKQCWAEVLQLYHANKLNPFADPKLRDTFKQHQEAAMEDDWREGKIAAYLDTKPAGGVTCVIEVFNACIATDERSIPTRRDSIEIGKIISALPDWEATGRNQRFANYGVQKCYQKKKNAFQTVIP